MSFATNIAGQAQFDIDKRKETARTRTSAYNRKVSLVDYHNKTADLGNAHPATNSANATTTTTILSDDYVSLTNDSLRNESSNSLNEATFYDQYLAESTSQDQLINDKS